MFSDTGNDKLRVVRTREEFDSLHWKLTDVVIKGLRLDDVTEQMWKKADVVEASYFLGCLFSGQTSIDLLETRGARILPPLRKTPYNPYRSELYTSAELLAPAAGGKSLDATIFEDYNRRGKFFPDVIEALSRRIHDYSIDQALASLIDTVGRKNVVGFMGGSSTRRTDPWYARTAQTARAIARAGRFVMSGGGPGMMEAANLGTYFAAFPDDFLDKAIEILGVAPTYTSDGWLKTALEVKSNFGPGKDSLGIPTWFYGTEPSNVFSTQIAKYFDNSIREGGLILLSIGGIVFAPGSAGTRQEIFMDAAQNFYGTAGYYSPMAFLGKIQYQLDAPVFPLLQQTANSHTKDMLTISDSPLEIASFISQTKPEPSTSS